MRIDDLKEAKTLNYTGIFFRDGNHMTWNYGFPLKYPKGVKAGDKVKVTVIGEYNDEQVACLVVKYDKYTTQPNKDTVLHITTKVTKGGKPVMSGQRATNKGYENVKQYTMNGVWK